MIALVMVFAMLAKSTSSAVVPPFNFTSDGLGFSTLQGGCAKPAAPTFSLLSNWPPGLTGVGQLAFTGGVFDGKAPWLVPYNADRVVRIDPSSGNMTGYSNWPGGFNKSNQAFIGGVFAYSSIWLVPSNANQVIRMSLSTGDMTVYHNWPAGLTGLGNGAFAGGVFDGTSIWLVPYNANQVVRIDPATGVMTVYSGWPAGFVKGSGAFIGVVLARNAIWLVPYNADRVIRMNLSTGGMTGYSDWPSGFIAGRGAFAGGVFDGTYIWLVPFNADRVIRLYPSTGMTGYRIWPAGFTKGSGAFVGGVFDGFSIWLVSHNADRVIRIDPSTGNMTGYPLSTVSTSAAFYGAAFNGTSMWLVPHNAGQALRLDLAKGCHPTSTPSLSRTATELSKTVSISEIPSESASLTPTFTLGLSFSRMISQSMQSSVSSYLSISALSASTWLSSQASSSFTTTVSQSYGTLSITLSSSQSLSVSQLLSLTTTLAITKSSSDHSDTVSRSNSGEISSTPAFSISLSATFSDAASRTRTAPRGANNRAPVVTAPTAMLATSVVSTTAASVVGSTISAGGSGADLQILFVVGAIRCNNSFLKQLSEDGQVGIIPLRIGEDTLNGLLGMLVLHLLVLILLLIGSMLGKVLFRWGSFLEGLQKAGFPSGAIALCGVLHQGTFFEALRIWAATPSPSPATLVGSVILVLLVIGAAVAASVWPLVALQEYFVPYRHVFKSFPGPLKLFILPQGYWTTVHPNSLMMRSSFGGFVDRRFCVFGLVNLARSLVIPLVVVVGKDLKCPAQSYMIAGVILATAVALLLFRPQNVRLTLVVNTISALLTSTIIILNQFDGLDRYIEGLTMLSSGFAIGSTIALLILKLLTIRWKAQEIKAIGGHHANIEVATTDVFFTESLSDSGDGPFEIPLLDVPLPPPRPNTDAVDSVSQFQVASQNSERNPVSGKDSGRVQRLDSLL